MKKRILSLVLALALCASLLPAALAATVSDGYDITVVEGVSTYGQHYFQDGLIPVQVPGVDPDGNVIVQWTYMNTSGEIVDLVSDKEAFYVFDFSEGLAAFLTFEFKLGYMDTTGKVVIQPQFDPCEMYGTLSVGRFINGNALVYNPSLGDWEQIDRNGNKVPVTLDPYGEDYAVISDTMGNPTGAVYETVIVDGMEMVLDFVDGATVCPSLDFESIYVINAVKDDGEKDDPAAPTVPVFTDVAADAWYAEPVAWAVEEGITNGTSATTFSPNATCTNAHILTFMWRAAGSPAPSMENPFSNLTGQEYYSSAAVWAYENGMISGSTFEADKPCTRAMTVEYFWAAAGRPEIAPSSQFSDVAADASYAQAVAWAVEEGITNGTSDTTFEPDTICTRGHIVTFLYRDLAA